MNPHRVTLQIAADHPALAGHFPGSPIVPGVVLLDETLHAIEQAQPSDDAAPCWHLGAVKFHHVARAGDSLQLEFEWQANGLVHFQMRAAHALIASGTVKRRASLRAIAGVR
jgi:3-hydroxyacyl-[acyl-carrier-protein] dehydratase